MAGCCSVWACTRGGAGARAGAGVLAQPPVQVVAPPGKVLERCPLVPACREGHVDGTQLGEPGRHPWVVRRQHRGEQQRLGPGPLAPRQHPGRATLRDGTVHPEPSEVAAVHRHTTAQLGCAKPGPGLVEVVETVGRVSAGSRRVAGRDRQLRHRQPPREARVEPVAGAGTVLRQQLPRGGLRAVAPDSLASVARAASTPAIRACSPRPKRSSSSRSPSAASATERAAAPPLARSARSATSRARAAHRGLPRRARMTLARRAWAAAGPGRRATRAAAARSRWASARSWPTRWAPSLRTASARVRSASVTSPADSSARARSSASTGSIPGASTA